MLHYLADTSFIIDLINDRNGRRNFIRHLLKPDVLQRQRFAFAIPRDTLGPPGMLNHAYFAGHSGFLAAGLHHRIALPELPW